MGRGQGQGLGLGLAFGSGSMARSRGTGKSKGRGWGTGMVTSAWSVYRVYVGTGERSSHGRLRWSRPVTSHMRLTHAC